MRIEKMRSIDGRTREADHHPDLKPCAKGLVLLYDRFFLREEAAREFLAFMDRRGDLRENETFVHALCRMVSGTGYLPEKVPMLEKTLAGHPWLIDLREEPSKIFLISAGKISLQWIERSARAVSRTSLPETDPALARKCAETLIFMACADPRADLDSFLGMMHNGKTKDWGGAFIARMTGMCDPEAPAPDFNRFDKFRKCDGKHLEERLVAFFDRFTLSPSPSSLKTAFFYALFAAFLHVTNYRNWDPLDEVRAFYDAFGDSGKVDPGDFFSNLFACFVMNCLCNSNDNPRDLLCKCLAQSRDLFLSGRLSGYDAGSLLSTFLAGFFNLNSGVFHEGFGALGRHLDYIEDVIVKLLPGKDNGARRVLGTLLRGLAVNRLAERAAFLSLEGVTRTVAERAGVDEAASFFMELCERGSWLADMLVPPDFLYRAVNAAVKASSPEEGMSLEHINGITSIVMDLIMEYARASGPQPRLLACERSPGLVPMLVERVVRDDPSLAAPGRIDELKRNLAQISNFFYQQPLPEKVVADIFFDGARRRMAQHGKADMAVAYSCAESLVAAVSSSPVISKSLIKNIVPSSLVTELMTADDGLPAGEARDAAERICGYLVEQYEELRRSGCTNPRTMIDYLVALILAHPRFSRGPHWMLCRYRDLGMLFLTGKRSIDGESIKNMCFMGLAKYIEKRPGLADPDNYPVLEEIVHFCLEYSKHGFYPDYLFDVYLEAAAADNPGIFHDCEGITDLLEGARHFLARGMVPILGKGKGDMPSLLDGLYRHRDGVPVPQGEETERALLYSAMCRHSDRAFYSQYFRVIDSDIPVDARRAFWERPLVTRGNTAREISLNEADAAEKVDRLRHGLLSLVVDSGIMRGEATALHCLGKGEKNFLARGFDYMNEDPAPIIERLWARQARNFQPQLSAFMEKLLIIKALKDDPGLRDALETGAAPIAAGAISELLEHRLIETLESIIPGRRIEDLTRMMERETGSTVRNHAFRDLGLKKMSRMVKEEIRAASHILELRQVLPGFMTRSTHGDSGKESVLHVGISLNPKDEPLLLLKKMYREYTAYHLRAGAAEGSVRFSEVRVYPNIPYGMAAPFKQDVEIRDGRFAHEAMNLVDTREGLFVFNHILDLGEEDLLLVRRIARVLSRRVLPLLDPLREFGRGILDELSGAMTRRWHTAECRDNLVLVPGKDRGLVFRNLPAEDCSFKFRGQLVHPSSIFYRMFHRGEWTGYVLLLELKGKEGDKALLVDVINTGSKAAVNWADAAEGLITYLAQNLVPGTYSRILLPSNRGHISNRDYVRDPIFARFGKHPRIPGGRYFLDPPDVVFHAAGGEYLVVAGEGSRINR